MPPHLQLTLLNVPPAVDAQAVLPRPQHVILNHTYCQRGQVRLRLPSGLLLTGAPRLAAPSCVGPMRIRVQGRAPAWQKLHACRPLLREASTESTRSALDIHPDPGI